MLGADLAFALMAAAAKFTGKHVGAAEIVFVRSLLSSIALLGVLRKNGVPLRANEPALLWTRGLVGYVALQCYFWAIPQLPLGTAVMLNYTAPIFAVILSFFVLREKPPLAFKLSLLISFFGVYLLCSPQLAGKGAALGAALVSGLGAGSVHVMIRQGRKSDSPLLMIFYFTLSATAGAGVLLFKTGWTNPSPAEWAGLLLITMSSFIGQLCLTHALQKAPVWAVAPFGYFAPLFSLALGMIFWGEKPSAANLIGGAVVIFCGVILLKKYSRT